MEYNIEQRRGKIVEILNDHGQVKVNELSRMFGISEVTIRFDLEDLESKGLLSRVYGGAVSSNRLYYEMDLKQRYATNENEKKAIAEHIAKMINNNDTIMMNSGTTLIYVMRAIRNRGMKNISIVTNSLQVASEASSYNDINVTVLGGLVDPKYQFTYGGDALEQLSKYHVDKLILSVDGINIENGYTLYYAHETDISRMMINHAVSTIIAADSSKISRVAFANISPLESADYIITDSKAKREYIELIKEIGINVHIVQF